MGKSIAPMLPLGGGKPQGLPPAMMIVAMSFHGYSSAGCSPAEPASASPAGKHSATPFPSSQIDWDQQPTKKGGRFECSINYREKVLDSTSRLIEASQRRTRTWGTRRLATGGVPPSPQPSCKILKTKSEKKTFLAKYSIQRS